jgi:hypothetical protein
MHRAQVLEPCLEKCRDAPIQGVDRHPLALAWIVGFSASFDDLALARASDALRTETCDISLARARRDVG